MVPARRFERLFQQPKCRVLPIRRSGIGTGGWSRTSRRRFWRPGHAHALTDIGSPGRDRTCHMLINSQPRPPCSAPAIERKWWQWLGSNQRPSPYEEPALPLSYTAKTRCSRIQLHQFRANCIRWRERICRMRTDYSSALRLSMVENLGLEPSSDSLQRIRAFPERSPLPARRRDSDTFISGM